jgi:hypothetical protein
MGDLLKIEGKMEFDIVEQSLNKLFLKYQFLLG